MKLLNAFSLAMVPPMGAVIEVVPVDLAEAKKLLAENDCESFVGHADTAAMLGKLLGRHVPIRRESVVLQKWEQALVAQYVGPRLPEGATALPNGAEIKWLQIVCRPPLAEQRTDESARQQMLAEMDAEQESAANNHAAFLSKVAEADAAGRVQILRKYEPSGDFYYDTGAIARSEAGVIFARRNALRDGGEWETATD